MYQNATSGRFFDKNVCIVNGITKRRFFYSLLITALLVSVSFITIIPASASSFGNSTNYGYINAIIARKVILDEPWGTGWNPETAGGNWEAGVSVSQFVYVVVISNNGFPIKGANVSGFYTAANGSTNLFPFSGTTDAEGEFNASKSLDNQVRIGQTTNAKGPNEGDWNITINVTYNGTTTIINRQFILGEYGCGRGGSGCHAPGGGASAKGTAMAPSALFSHDPYIQGVSADGTTQSSHQVYQPTGDAHEAPRGTAAGTNCETCHRAYNQDVYNATNAYLNNATPLSGNGLHEANGVKCKDCHKNTTIGGIVQTRYEVPQCYDSGCHTNTINIPKTWVQSITDSYSWNQHAHDTNQTIACIFCHGPFHNNTKPNTSVPLVANGVTESENCANNCHKNQVYHNATVDCTVCHSQAAHEIRYFNSTGDYTYNKTQSPGGLNVGRKYAGKCSTCHQKPYFARLLNHSNNLSDPYDAANGSYSKGPGGAKIVPYPLAHSNAQNNGSKWGNYWKANNDSSSCMYCHGDVYANINFSFTDALGHVWQFKGNNVVNGSISSSSYWCASCHWQGYTSGGKTYNDMVSSFLSDNDPVPPEITGNATYGANQSVPGYRNHNSDAKNDASCKNCHGGYLSTSATITDFMHKAEIGIAGESQPTYIPPTPSGLTPTQNNFWVNYTWTSGSGNITNSYNVSHNSGWTNNTIPFRNNTVGPHGWSNITVYAYNNSGAGQLSQTPATMNTQVANNVPVLGSIGPKTVTAGQLLTFAISATDADSDPLTNATNATKGSFTPSTGLYTWTPAGIDVGTYLWEFNTSDTYGGIDSETITVTVNALPTYIPPTPSGLTPTQNNFWVNYTWTSGSGNITNSYNVSHNSGWTNNTIPFRNNTVGPHGWSNITVYAYNNSGAGQLSQTPATMNTQVANNVPVLGSIGPKTVTAGQLLTFAISATDADSDPLTNATNATKGSFTPSTGLYTWTPAGIDVGTYLWEFNTSDTYGGIDSETITVTVNALPTYIPPTPSGLTPTQNNFWVNYTWTSGSGNITNSYNVSHNSGWTNNTIPFRNNTVGPHGWSNITVYAYNNSGAGQLSQTPATMNTQVANNVPVLGSIGPKTVTAGQLLTFAISATDADSDPLTNATNATKGSFTPSTGLYTWTPAGIDVGTYLWEFNTSDTYGGIDSETITVTVTLASTYTPPAPLSIASTQGNFWVNTTWQAGIGGNVTNSYNVSVNGSWTNGTTQVYINSSVPPHGWSNVTVYAYNNSGTGTLSNSPVILNTQKSNNAPVQAYINPQNAYVGDLLTLIISATDADSDTITYSTTSTKGSLNSTTGVYTWAPVAGDIGTTYMQFNSSDAYGGNAGQLVTINVGTLPAVRYINGTVRDNSTGNPIADAIVTANSTLSTITNATGFYSFAVVTGTYNLIARNDPTYYTNNTVSASTSGVAVVNQDVRLHLKPTGTITGNVIVGP